MSLIYLQQFSLDSQNKRFSKVVHTMIIKSSYLLETIELIGCQDYVFYIKLISKSLNAGDRKKAQPLSIVVLPPPNCSLHFVTGNLILHPLRCPNWAVPICTVAQPRNANTTSPDGRTGVGQGPVEQSGAGCRDVSDELGSGVSSGPREGDPAID